MSAFGLLHTLVSVLPLAFGLVAFARNGRIEPTTRLGKWYLGTILAGTVSSWGFLLTKGFTPAQVLTLVTLGVTLLALFTLRGTWRTHGYVQTISLSLTYLLLWVFTTTETLTRVPVGRPFATGPDDPALLPVRLVLLTIFAIGVTFQVRAIRAERRQHGDLHPATA